RVRRGRLRARDPTGPPGRFFSARAGLLVAPDVLEAPPAVERMMGDEALHVGPHGEVVEAPFQHGTARRLLELELDLAHEGETLRLVQLLRLLLDELGDGLVAVVRVVPRRAAGVGLEGDRVANVGRERGPGCD